MKKRLRQCNINLFHKESWGILDNNTKSCISTLRKIMKKDNRKIIEIYLLLRQVDGQCHSQLRGLKKQYNLTQLDVKSKSIRVWDDCMAGLMTNMCNPEHCLDILHVLDCTIQKKK
jgi:hypothetical protein